MERAETILSKIAGALSTVSYVGFAFITLLMVADVLIRFFSTGAITGAYEIVQWCLCISVFSAFAYTQSKRGHIHVTLMLIHMPGKLRFLCYFVMSLLSAGGAVLLTYSIALQTAVAYNDYYITSLLRMPKYPFYFIAAFSSGVFSLLLLFDALKSAVAIFNKKTADSIQKDWV
ncbi:MAG: TRAP transporter small permease [Oscillospiraceae bacterium]|nr:TRAP transporter small permease [Oscillospiraceae bacterium]